MCFQLTRDDQQRDDNTKRYSLSKWAQCNTLISSYEGPYRLILEPGTLTGAFTPSFYDRLIARLGLSD